MFGVEIGHNVNSGRVPRTGGCHSDHIRCPNDP